MIFKDLEGSVGMEGMPPMVMTFRNLTGSLLDSLSRSIEEQKDDMFDVFQHSGRGMLLAGSY